VDEDFLSEERRSKSVPFFVRKSWVFFFRVVRQGQMTKLNWSCKSRTQWENY